VERRVRAALGRPRADAAGAAAARHRAPPRILGLLGRVDGPGERERRGAYAMAGLVVAVAVVTAVWVFADRPHAAGPAQAGATPTIPTTTTPATSAAAHVLASPAVVVVDVAGKVRRPGIYRLPTGSRVDDAVRAAGGALPGVDLATVNLAAVLSDGQQIAVGVASAPTPTSRQTSGAPAGPISLNSATLEQLETLPGVGPVLAQNIIDWRTERGSFASIDELAQVPGIGDAKFASLRSLVTL
jgi:competence protein ComEA